MVSCRPSGPVQGDKPLQMGPRLALAKYPPLNRATMVLDRALTSRGRNEVLKEIDASFSAITARLCPEGSQSSSWKASLMNGYPVGFKTMQIIAQTFAPWNMGLLVTGVVKMKKR